MGGALLELLAIGEQDVKLIGNPQFTYFKTVYMTHTNFSIQSIPQYFRENPDFGKKMVCIIDKSADLLHQIFLDLELPALQSNVSWINGIGNHIIKNVSVEIGGITICTMTGEYLDIFSELTTDESKKGVYYKMIGKYSSYNRNSQIGSLRLFVPLPFWFCKVISNAVPLVGMQYSEVKIIVEFRPFSQTWYSGTSMAITPTSQNITNAFLLCDFIYLDTYERRKVASTPKHEYLIEQVQLSEGNVVSQNITKTNVDFSFNHPIINLN